MRRYILASGTFFGLVALAQLTRAIAAVPVRAGDFTIPVWWSAVAFLLAGGFAVWAYRVVKQAD